MYISCCLCKFLLRWVANVIPLLGGIQALVISITKNPNVTNFLTLPFNLNELSVDCLDWQNSNQFLFWVFSMHACFNIDVPSLKAKCYKHATFLLLGTPVFDSGADSVRENVRMYSIERGKIPNEDIAEIICDVLGWSHESVNVLSQ